MLSFAMGSLETLAIQFFFLEKISFIFLEVRIAHDPKDADEARSMQHMAGALKYINAPYLFCCLLFC